MPTRSARGRRRRTRSRAAEAKPSNPEAFELYLRGRYRAGRWNEKDTDEAIALLERSTALDPEFGPSQALLGYVYGVKSFNYRPDEAQWIEKGYAAVEKALALDPASPYAHLARGRLLWRHSQGFPHLDALAEYRQSLAASPNFDEAWHERGIVLFHVGHLEAGLRAVQQAIALNPGNTLARFRLGPLANYLLKPEEAIALLKRVPREVYPAQWTYHMSLALISLGRLDEASREIESALAGNVPIRAVSFTAFARCCARSRATGRAPRPTSPRRSGSAGASATSITPRTPSARSIPCSATSIGRRSGSRTPRTKDFPATRCSRPIPSWIGCGAARDSARFVTALRKEWEHIPGEAD